MLCTLLPLAAAHAAFDNNTIHKASFSSTGFETTITLKLERESEYKAFMLDNPSRLVLDIPNGDWKLETAQDVIAGNKLIRNIRVGTPAPQVFRIVFDLNDKAGIKNHVLNKPTEKDPEASLVISLSTDRAFLDAGKVGPKKPEQFGPPPPPKDQFEDTGAAGKTIAKPVVKPSRRTKPYTPVIVLDPGHGGIDPGAQGSSGIYEKELTLRYAKALKTVLQNRGYKVYLTRSTDSFVKLGDRVKTIKKWKPDLMISLHADAHEDPTLRGLSVYTLADQRADRVAKVMKKKASQQEVIKGIDMRNSGEEVQDLIIDMAQQQSQSTASKFANMLVQELGDDAKLLSKPHRHGSFEVLTGLEVPSVLMELGFLSHPHEEKMLRKAEYQSKLIKNIVTAIDRYFENIQPE